MSFLIRGYAFMHKVFSLYLVRSGAEASLNPAPMPVIKINPMIFHIRGHASLLSMNLLFIRGSQFFKALREDD
jgi:hypothetical protein